MLIGSRVAWICLARYIRKHPHRELSLEPLAATVPNTHDYAIE
jgi:hypothetical protein